MIKEIYISNFALIEDQRLSLESGFTVVTGETGSGKSIFLEALALALGERADKSVIRNQDKKCVVELVLDISSYDLKDDFVRLDIDYEPETIIRREIAPSGKSRAFVNDTPLVLNDLKELSQKLVRISSQHETLSLKSIDFQLQLLDSFIENPQLINEIKELNQLWREKNNDLKEKQENISKIESDREYFVFQLEELTSADLDKEPLFELEDELSLVEKSGEIGETIQVSIDLLDQENAIIDLLTKVEQKLKISASYDVRLKEFSNRLNTSKEELKDVSSSLQNYIDALDISPERLIYLQERVDLLNRLLMKHKKSDLADLVLFRNEIAQRINNSEELAHNLDVLKEEIQLIASSYIKVAAKLQFEREQAAYLISTQIRQKLSDLGMEQAEVKFDIIPNREINENGGITLDFQFKANEGLGFQSLKKSASGGELSRLMLAVQSLYSQKKQLPTLIFDEIDTGVSGEIAAKIAKMLKKMAARMQMIAITHLPQVAAKGNHHYLVHKFTKNASTYTHIKKIIDQERIKELAKMLSGDSLSETAYEHAKELMID